MSNGDDQNKSTVICKRCGKPIVIAPLTRQLTEFSVKCDNCAKRSFYTPEEIVGPVRR